MMSGHADGVWEGTKTHADICGNLSLLGVAIGNNEILDEKAAGAMDWVQAGACLGMGVERVGTLRLVGEAAATTSFGRGEEISRLGLNNYGYDSHTASSGYIRGGAAISDIGDTPIYLKAMAEHRGSFTGNVNDRDDEQTKSANSVRLTVGAAF
ncbi:MAG: hypothetical protein AAB425_10145, partial [Bdellovibrionota bacterium]